MSQQQVSNHTEDIIVAILKGLPEDNCLQYNIRCVNYAGIYNSFEELHYLCWKYNYKKLKVMFFDAQLRSTILHYSIRDDIYKAYFLKMSFDSRIYSLKDIDTVVGSLLINPHISLDEFSNIIKVIPGYQRYYSILIKGMTGAICDESESFLYCAGHQLAIYMDETILKAWITRNLP